MPLNLAKLAANRAKVAVDFGDGNTLNIEYYPDHYTTDFMLQMAALDDIDMTNATAEQKAAKLQGPVSALNQLLASWDATETDDATGEDAPLPLDLAHLLPLPISTLSKMLAAIAKDAAGEASAPGA